jgi:hypothetical protein
VVQRYLRFIRMVGRPPDRSFCAQFVGRFRLRKRLGWMPAEALQHNTSPDIARIYVMRLRFARVLPMIGRDIYHQGHGRMVGKVLDRWTVAEGHGEAFDVSELVTYLNDAVLLAPSMLLTPATVWTAVDANTFDVTLTDAGRHVTGRVRLDGPGAPVDFATNDRYIDLPGGPVQADWHTPIAGWTTVGDRPLPENLSAVWHLPSGPFTYASGRFVPESLSVNRARHRDDAASSG